MIEFQKKFQIKELEIARVGNWIISLRPEQVTLGSLVLSLNRKCTHFGGLDKIEGEQLTMAFKKIESLLASTFKPDKINYLALMMVDNQVHYHIIPRYENQLSFKNNTYTDKDWAKPPNILNIIHMTMSDLEGLKECFLVNK